MTVDVVIINTPVVVSIVQADGPVVTVQAPPIAAVSTTTVGMQGPPGPSGGGNSRYVHTQATALTVWTVAHNLGFNPAVTVFTVGGVQVIGGEVANLNLNTLTITFDLAFAGSAALI